MPPVKTVASSTDVDNDATAELPVLDVAAYEATLDESESISNTDTWSVPSIAASAGSEPVMPVGEAIPTLRPAEPQVLMDQGLMDQGGFEQGNIDLSGTHEMPAVFKPNKASANKAHANKLIKATPVTAPTAVPAVAVPAVAVSTMATPAARAYSAPAPVTLPPHPPLIEELRGGLAAAERRIEELNERARIADTERALAVGRANAECAQLREQLGLQLESLHSARGRQGVVLSDLPALEDELFTRADRIAALERELAAQAQTLVQVRASLDASEKRGLGLDADTTNLRAANARRDEQIATLEADLAARQTREAHLRAGLDEALASIDPQIPDLRAKIAARDEKVRALESALATAHALATEKNADLEVAEESIRNFEIEVRDKAGKLDEANVTVEEWRAVIAESQRSILQRDGRIQQLEADLEKRLVAVPVSAPYADKDGTGEEVLLEGPARVLIRTDGNTDFVHVLGRRTRIGRGDDNELVLETKHISRYHAVLLAGPVHTSIEDLNSTNGVFVNGKRVSRQALKDGDRVTIGRTHFRYSVRT